MSDSAAELQAGRVGRPHGLDGSFYVTGALPRLLALGAAVIVQGRSAEIVRRAGTDARPIIRLQGVSDRAGAEALRGVALVVAAGGAPSLGEDEWWAHELQDCEVFDGGRLLGTVSRMIELPSCEAIEVASAGGGGPLLVPLVKDAIRKVDTSARRIEVDGEFLDLRPSEPPRRKAQAAARGDQEHLDGD
ncbi:MAG: rRNA processing protein RimM [Solirubrobacteraceae bacterium]|nr:rRNA processing protein RimM [Solirubrobacteraceae bacterium]